MDDKIETTRERVEECAMLIRELLDEYNCNIHCDIEEGKYYIENWDAEPPFHEVEL